MPFKSQAQRRKFAELLVKGEISSDTFEEWNRETGGARLPERVKRKAGAKRTARGVVRKPVTKRKRSTKRKNGAKRTRKKKSA
jgi:hypothetical protein